MRSDNIVILFLLVAAIAGLSACAKPEQPAGNPEQPINQASPRTEVSPGSPGQSGTPLAMIQPSPGAKANLPPPGAEEVQAAVTRIFKNVVAIDTGRTPNFIAGDFNADGSQDLAVIVKPSDDETSYLELNNELANWLVREPRKIVVAKALGEARANEATTKPDPIRKGEELVAVIHGFGPTGWRNPEARQTFVLKGVAGTGLRSESVKELASHKADLPLLNGQVINNGDIISETIDGERGMLFWTGSAYSWHAVRR
jgi:hypothetical protein